MADARTYRPSAKRAAAREEKRAAIKAAGWKVFAEIGLDAATVAEIVAESGVSTGSFYNYFGTREAVFDELLAEMVGIVRQRTRAARAQADDLRTMLLLSYKAFLDFVLETEGGREFCARNQPHIRARLYGLESTGGVLSDLKTDIARGMPQATFSDWELSLIASLILANGMEALLQSRALPDLDTEALSRIMTGLAMDGIAHRS